MLEARLRTRLTPPTDTRLIAVLGKHAPRSSEVCAHAPNFPASHGLPAATKETCTQPGPHPSQGHTAGASSDSDTRAKAYQTPQPIKASFHDQMQPREAPQLLLGLACKHGRRRRRGPASLGSEVGGTPIARVSEDGQPTHTLHATNSKINQNNVMRPCTRRRAP